MENLFSKISLDRYKVKAPRKDEEKRKLRQRLADILGWSTKRVWGATMIWKEDMLRDSIRACENYTDVKARVYFFNQYKESTKVKA